MKVQKPIGFILLLRGLKLRGVLFEEVLNGEPQQGPMRPRAIPMRLGGHPREFLWYAARPQGGSRPQEDGPRGPPERDLVKDSPRRGHA